MFDENHISHLLREKFLPGADDYLFLANTALLEKHLPLTAQILKAGLILHPRQTDLRNRFELVCQTLFSTNDLPLPSTKKIFGIGLSRTGTASLNESLKLLGFSAAHWMLPETKKIIDWQEFLTVDAVSDTPVSFIFETLYYAFPDSYFIYTTRNIEKWSHSIKEHFHWLKSVDKLKKLCLEGNGNGGTVDSYYWRMIHMALYANCHSWEDAYQKHDGRIRKFFSTTPEARLLELDITNPLVSSNEKWHVIAQFLELADAHIPLLPFPKKNDKSGVNQRKASQMLVTLPLAWQQSLTPAGFSKTLAAQTK